MYISLVSMPILIVILGPQKEANWAPSWLLPGAAVLGAALGAAALGCTARPAVGAAGGALLASLLIRAVGPQQRDTV